MLFLSYVHTVLFGSGHILTTGERGFFVQACRIQAPKLLKLIKRDQTLFFAEKKVENVCTSPNPPLLVN